MPVSRTRKRRPAQPSDDEACLPEARHLIGLVYSKKATEAQERRLNQLLRHPLRRLAEAGRLSDPRVWPLIEAARADHSERVGG